MSSSNDDGGAGFTTTNTSQVAPYNYTFTLGQSPFYLLLNDFAYGYSGSSANPDVYSFYTTIGQTYTLLIGNQSPWGNGSIENLAVYSSANLASPIGTSTYLTTQANGTVTNYITFTATSNLYYLETLPSGPGFYNIIGFNQTVSDSFVQGQTINAGIVYGGAISYTSDSDNYLMSAIAGHTYAALLLNTDPNLNIKITDTATDLHSNAVVTPSGSYASIVTFTPSQSGVYEVSLSSNNFTSTGSYAFIGYDVTNPIFTLTGSQISAYESALYGLTINYTLIVSDTAANVVSNLSAIQTLSAAGKISSIRLTDGGTPTLSISASGQGLSAIASLDSAALSLIATPYNLVITDTDSVISSVSTALPAGYLNLALIGTGNINGTGNDAGDTIIGNSGNNIFTGGAGNDTINGGGGIDTAIYSGVKSGYSITHNSNGSVTIAGANGTDTLTSVEFAQFSDGTVSLMGQVRNDLNGDGKGDILWQNSDGTAAVWLLNGATVGGGNTVGNPGSASWHAIATGDFDGDGKADILWQNSDGTPAVWLMNGSTVTGGGIPGTNPGPAWTVLGAADFNGDGKADILWRASDGSIAVWLMNGSNLTGGAVAGNPGAGWNYKATGDFNGDGKTDILFQNTNGSVAIWLMNGASLSGGAVVGNPSGTWQVKAAGDFDGDGKSDILFQDATGQVAIWQMNGTTIAGGGIAGTNPGTAWTVKQAEDVNGDGKADILWQAADGSPAAWLMNGTTLTGGGIIGTNPGTSWHVVTG